MAKRACGGLAGIVEAEHEAIFGFGHLTGRVQAQAFVVAVEINNGDEQVERQAGRHERRTAGGGRHCTDGLEDVAREVGAGEGQLEPAAADQAAEFDAHLLARIGLHLLGLFGVAAAREPDQRSA